MGMTSGHPLGFEIGLRRNTPFEDVQIAPRRDDEDMIRLVRVVSEAIVDPRSERRMRSESLRRTPPETESPTP